LSTQPEAMEESIDVEALVRGITDRIYGATISLHRKNWGGTWFFYRMCLGCVGVSHMSQTFYQLPKKKELLIFKVA